MKTNYALLAAVLLSLSAWGAGQFVSLHFDYPYWPNAKYPIPPGPKVWHRDVSASFSRGGIYLKRIVADPGKSEFINANTKIIWVKAADKRETPFWAPSLNASYGWYSIGIPYWMLMLLPAVWLAWRVYRVRLNSRGFEVATA